MRHDLLREFFCEIAEDPRVSPLHVSVYCALCNAWYLSSWKEPMVLQRDALMKHAKLSGRTTYNKCMWDLHAFGFIKYIPGSNQFMPSLVYMDTSRRNNLCAA